MKNILLTSVVAIIVSMITVSFLSPQNSMDVQAEESAYDRVKRTQTIRCGYAFEEPALSINPETGQLSGIFYDLTNRMGDLLGYTVEWVEEAGWTELSTGLQHNRYDVACIGKWIFAPQVKNAIFTMPTYYSAVHAYVRSDETRVKEDLSNLNDAQFKLVTIDGELNHYLALDRFPKAGRVELPAMSDAGQAISNITTEKADVMMLAVGMAESYMQQNPGKLKQLTTKPVAVFDTAYMVKAGEESLVSLLNAALRQLHSDGYIEHLIHKHGGKKGYRPLALPYKQ